jgi:addiction module RelB/DinJ family antitoxin
MIFNAKMKNIQFRVQDEKEVQAKKILQAMGLDMPTFLRMCVIAVVQKKALPFQPVAETDENGFTIDEQEELDKRIRDAKEGKNIVEYESSEAFLNDLKKDI